MRDDDRFDLTAVVVKVVKGYGLPLGKTLRARLKEGDGSPYRVDARGDRSYQFRLDEVSLFPRNTVRSRWPSAGWHGIEVLAESGEWEPWGGPERSEA